jgi:hypothetical protein
MKTGRLELAASHPFSNSYHGRGRDRLRQPIRTERLEAGFLPWRKDFIATDQTGPPTDHAAHRARREEGEGGAGGGSRI